MVRKIFTFYINDVRLFKCPFPGPKGYTNILTVDLSLAHELKTYSNSILSKITSKCAAVRSAAYQRAAALLMCAHYDGVTRTDTGTGTQVIVEGEQVTLHPSLHTLEDTAFCGNVYRSNERTDSTLRRLGLEMYVWRPTIQGVIGGTDQTSGGCSLGHTIPI